MGAFGALVLGEAAVAFLLAPVAGACLLACTGAMGFLQYRGEHRVRGSATPIVIRKSPRAGQPGANELTTQVGRDVARAKRYKHPLTLAVIDIPKFDELKAGSGEETTREVVQHVRERIQRTIREADCLVQVRDDRFVATLTDCTAEQAKVFSERVMRQVDGRPVLTGEKGCVPVEVNVEVTALQYDAARFPTAEAYIAAAQGDPSAQPIELTSHMRGASRGRDVRLLRRQLIREPLGEPLERVS